MSFNSFAFIWLFFPIVFAVFFLAPRRWRITVLLIASFGFYGLAGPSHLLLLIAEIVWVYAITSSRRFPGSVFRLCLAIGLPLIGLVYFKYAGFLLRDVFAIPDGVLQGTIFESILLPAAISFFTFEMMSYAFDRFRGDIETPAGFVDFSLLVSFFPHLVAGPILRFQQFGPQLKDVPTFRLDMATARTAILQICFGFGVKILVADWLALYVGSLKDSLATISGADGLFLIFGFSFQIYFDFFGYSLIAIGLGRLFGIVLPDNFRQPYHALNPRDFWRRWHISLSFWLRDYVYLPLGGNRRYLINILIVFAVCGIWHGAGWNFLVWGLLHAALVIAYHFGAPLWDRLPHMAQRGGTFMLVSLAWLPFFLDLDQIAQLAAGLRSGWERSSLLSIEAWLAMLAAVIACYLLTYERISAWVDVRPDLRLRAGLAAGCVLALSLLYLDRTATFIYFRF
jgi:alginate O-acetyltransferase complex protein AlgI